MGEADGQAYIAMELVDGRPLDQIIPAGGLAISNLFACGLQIAEAVAHAHEKGVLHRDLKTANIMVTPAGRVKVLDFGLAKRLAREGRPDVTSIHLPFHTNVSLLQIRTGPLPGTARHSSQQAL